MKPKIIYQTEFNFPFYNCVEVPYCAKCRNRVSLLGLLDKKGNLQYFCKKCNKIIKVKNDI